MRISDWSSDGCSSDLGQHLRQQAFDRELRCIHRARIRCKRRHTPYNSHAPNDHFALHFALYASFADPGHLIFATPASPEPVFPCNLSTSAPIWATKVSPMTSMPCWRAHAQPVWCRDRKSVV